ncbi:VOC family protein [Polycladidibacter stylochi]|uniref:VOC family protein n=1 Tax=Polycladidibacter stylochi TaxID=1807766 RepID=UPI00082ECBF4|nr:VOC family protein [Pseudovibrio stylochi]
MTSSFLEHANITVSDPERSAKNLCHWFGWHIRWQGSAKDNGHSIHVGNENSYLVVYKPQSAPAQGSNPGKMVNGLNHVAVVVADLDATEQRILASGFKTMNHADYEPGRRFYFYDHDGIEFEVVNYG